MGNGDFEIFPGERHDRKVIDYLLGDIGPTFVSVVQPFTDPPFGQDDRLPVGECIIIAAEEAARWALVPQSKLVSAVEAKAGDNPEWQALLDDGLENLALAQARHGNALKDIPPEHDPTRSALLRLRIQAAELAVRGTVAEYLGLSVSQEHAQRVESMYQDIRLARQPFGPVKVARQPENLAVMLAVAARFAVANLPPTIAP